MDLAPQELAVLDAFEGDEYERRLVPAALLVTAHGRLGDPALGGQGKPLVATYAYTGTRDLLLAAGSWDFDNFRKDHLVAFQTQCRDFSDDYYARCRTTAG